ncbi:hypothetical protein N0V83_007717 [Neocucurbitaria cava]|uniref:Uncharacterized protein n=1 Tax=Neocucurbitaria cava TaxID=798079 RepID=A0A9W8Y567_9PLEO|nr:hypothetical protein N0V83_007717 [Neocucurbitaria cava]
MPSFPSISHRDGLTLMFFTSVQTWSVAFFESIQRSNDLSVAEQQRLSKSDEHSAKEPGFAFKLVIDLLDRGRGLLAGRVARKAFLLIEDMLSLEGPGLVWNLLEIMHYMVSRRHMQLFDMLLAHMIALADGRVGKAHPLPSILRGLQNFIGTRTSSDTLLISDDVSSLIQRAWILNAEILFKNFDTRLFQFYCRILWDSCSIGPPAAVVYEQLELQQVSSAATISRHVRLAIMSTSSGEDRMLQRLLTPRTDAFPLQDYKMLRTSSIAALRELGDSLLSTGLNTVRDTSMLLPMLAGLATAKILEGTEDPSVYKTRILASNVACAMRSLIDFDMKHNGKSAVANLGTVEQIRAIVALREYAECETHPQVVQELWQLQDALVAAGNLEAAQEVGQDAYRRVENYIQDIPY